MGKSPAAVTRRDFLKGATFAALAATMGMPGESFGDSPQEKQSRVVLIRNENLLDESGQIKAQVLDEMLGEAMQQFFEKEKSADAWQVLFGPEDTIGIKSNSWGPLPTPAELEEAIKNGLISAGVKAENIAADDRGALKNPVFKKATAFVNASPMRTHHWSGVGGCLKNPIMFTPTPWAYHDNSCADLAKLFDLPVIKDKIKLNVLVMFTPLFHGVGAHHFDKTYTWTYNGLLLSTDPVAVDAVGLSILNAKRREYFGEERPIKPPPHHIVFAETKYKLGFSDPNKIELIKLGWQKDILI
jgi:hypothetical protein